MFTRNSKRNVKRALLFAPLAILLGIMAVSAQDPSLPVAEEGVALERAFSALGIIPLRSSDAPQPDWRELAKAPTFTPFTQAPVLTNADATKVAVSRNYPPMLKDAGIGGQTIVWFLIDETGVVRVNRVYKSSGYPQLDEAALKVASGMEFSPAKNRENVVPVWVQIPITFSLPRTESSAPGARGRSVNEVRAAGDSQRRSEEDLNRAVEELRARRQVEAEKAIVEERRSQSDTIARASRRGQQPPMPQRRASEQLELAQGPVFTPMTQPPRLINTQDVERLIQRYYPPLLRDAGIGGHTVMWYFIDESGKVLMTRLAVSSGYTQLDEAASALAKNMKFTPAMNRDQVVPVWVQIPITFSAK